MDRVQEGYRCQRQADANILVYLDEGPSACSRCGEPKKVQKTVRRKGVTIAHGPFQVRQTVRVCGCRWDKPVGQIAVRESPLAGILMPNRVVGYDLMVHIGLERFLHHRQREEIRVGLKNDHSIVLSTGEISVLARAFLDYLDRLHQVSAPALRATLEADGGWPLHINATGEDGRGTLLLAFAGWRQWVLGAWKIPTERCDAILPKLQSIVELFGWPSAIMRDLGAAMEEAAQSLVEQHKLSIPILACHQHFLNDIGEDLLQDDHDRLRALFREVNLRSKLRTLARDLGRSVGSQIGQARQNLLQWQADTDAPLPEGATGLATVRAMVQWILDYLLRWRRLLKRLIPSLPPLAKRIGAMFGLGK